MNYLSRVRSKKFRCMNTSQSVFDLLNGLRILMFLKNFSLPKNADKGIEENADKGKTKGIHELLPNREE